MISGLHPYDEETRITLTGPELPYQNTSVGLYVLLDKITTLEGPCQAQGQACVYEIYLEDIH
jgi:hypothetical protein